MRLSAAERRILASGGGRGAARAMELLAGLGRIAGARDMVEVGSVQVSGVSYANIGEHGLAFLEEWAGQGSRAAVPAYMNPGGADRRLWRSLGFSRGFVSRQERVVAALERLGIQPALTCAPYHCGVVPRPGEHVAWAESSAVCYANSVLGARTNREGGPSALAAALAGRTPRHGLHTDAGRRPTRVVEVRCPVETSADAGALGLLVGRASAADPGGGVPFIRGAAPPEGQARAAWLKALGAGMAASGAVGLYHIEGVTPEARAAGPRLAARVRVRTVIPSLSDAFRGLDSGLRRLDLVALGCPHASLEELARIGRLLAGRRVKARLWVFVAEETRREAAEDGLLRPIEAAGARVVADTCMVVAPLADLGFRSVAVDSAKAAFYLASRRGMRVRFGPTERAVEAAVLGAWPRSLPPGDSPPCGL